jgi:hypothetical protein
MSLIYVFMQRYPSLVGRDIPGYPVLSFREESGFQMEAAAQEFHGPEA